MDTRPANCRFRLQEEGKPYPRSSCEACHKTITTGLGTHCTVASGAVGAVEDFSGVMLQPILDLWEDLVRAGGMPPLQPEHVTAMARAIKRAAAST